MDTEADLGRLALALAAVSGMLAVAAGRAERVPLTDVATAAAGAWRAGSIPSNIWSLRTTPRLCISAGAGIRRCERHVRLWSGL